MGWDQRSDGRDLRKSTCRAKRGRQAADRAAGGKAAGKLVFISSRLLRRRLVRRILLRRPRRLPHPDIGKG